jgi:hypothetical protein
VIAVDRSGIISEMGLAVYKGKEIPEICAITSKNSLSTNADIHFGLSKDMTPVTKVNDCPVISDYLKMMGPRAIDIANRGRRIAEATWHYFNLINHFITVPEEVSQIKSDFRKDSKDLIIKWNESLQPKSLVYPQNAKLKGIDISKKQKYKKSAKTKWDVEDPRQRGTRWSKAELYLAVKKYFSNVHFHLDGMGDIHDVVTKLGNYSYNVTARELRFVFRVWQEFKKCTRFYNGYKKDFNVVEVECPWKNDESFTFAKTFN